MSERYFVGASGLDDDGLRLALAPALTPDGVDDRPAFFRGTVAHPQVLARALVTLADITGIFSSFEIMQQAKTELKDCIVKLGNQGKLVQMQLEQLAGSSMDTEYDLMIRDYASDSSEANAEKIRAELSRMTPKDLSDPQHVAAVLGYDDLDEDSVMTPLGLRTLSRVSVVRDGVAEKIVDEYGSLQELMDDISEDPERLGDFGVNNPAILADSLYRMKGTKQGNA